MLSSACEKKKRVEVEETACRQAMEDDEAGNAADCTEWTWEDNKLFELALATIDDDDGENSDRWGKVASMIGGKKSAEEVRQHYELLLEDLDIIESGRLDHEFLVVLGNLPDASWTDRYQELLAHFSIC